ncbi:MAG: SIS domain-containing protein [Sedimentisphaerales bacterium]|nr:SIS domain-containing protein [Sedimentisphaerales bacterium]
MTYISSEQLLGRARQVIESEAKAIRDLKNQLTEDIAKIVEAILTCEGHVLVAGAGTCWAIAERFAHLLACCGTPALFINAANAIHGGSGSITDKDIVYVISKGGQTGELNKFVQIAKDRGARIIAQTEKPDSPLGRLSDVIYHIVAPEEVDPYGMIATGSSLVNAAACDALCILLLELRGYTKDQFGRTHPGGAVGEKLRKNQES